MMQANDAEDHVSVGCVQGNVRRRLRRPRQRTQRRVPAARIPAANHDPMVQIYEQLRIVASRVIHLFIPVSICMALVIASIYSIGFYTRDDGVYLVYTPFIPEKDDNAGTQALFAMGNALLMLAVIVVMTFVLLLLYKFHFYKTIHAWIHLSSMMALSLLSAIYLREFLISHNFGMDFVTFWFIIWNWAAMGMMCIHWKSPLLLQQGYLISISVLMALTLIKHLPNWTVWTVLGAISIWDIIAVLCPLGPLRILVETAQERDEPLPGLIYSSAPIPGTKRRRKAEDTGVQLGLGDFVFYSILIGKASTYGDWNTTIACYVAILQGLVFTIMLHAFTHRHRALPALPISIFAGIIFFFLTREVPLFT